MTVAKTPVTLSKALIFLVFLLWGCSPNTHILEPEIHYIPQTRQFQSLPSPFPELSTKEIKEDWGKELKIGIAFARKLDLYRAVTAFERAQILIPKNNIEREVQIQYDILKAYFIGGKPSSAIATFEDGPLSTVTPNFSAWEELILMLADAYRVTGSCTRYEMALNYLDEETAQDLSLGAAIQTGDLNYISCHTNNPDIRAFLDCYCKNAKSPKKAQILNAILPGAGYYYVGQTNTAITSFIMNSLFIAATYHFFHHGNWGAGLITLSLETGWYFGGINGAGIAAKQYNECLYESLGKEVMIKNRLFPILKLETSF